MDVREEWKADLSDEQWQTIVTSFKTDTTDRLLERKSKEE